MAKTEFFNTLVPTSYGQRAAVVTQSVSPVNQTATWLTANKKTTLASWATAKSYRVGTNYATQWASSGTDWKEVARVKCYCTADDINNLKWHVASYDTAGGGSPQARIGNHGASTIYSTLAIGTTVGDQIVWSPSGDFTVSTAGWVEFRIDVRFATGARSGLYFNGFSINSYDFATPPDIT